MNWLPVVSQVKSFVQWAAGDSEGARKTQEDFVNQCPIVSQTKSLVHAIQGDNEAARQTQKQFGGAMSNLADGIPVVGHVKGVAHYVAGDKEGGDQAMKSASRTVGVIAGGVAGTFVGGPVGAVTGGIAGGAAMDGITTGVESAIHQEFRPNGNIALVTRIAKGESQSIAGDVFDLTSGIVFDGVAGRGAGKMVQARAVRPRGVSAGEGALEAGRAHWNPILENAGEFMQNAERNAVLEAGRAHWNPILENAGEFMQNAERNAVLEASCAHWDPILEAAKEIQWNVLSDEYVLKLADGNNKIGLMHILKKHKKEFATIGYDTPILLENLFKRLVQTKPVKVGKGYAIYFDEVSGRNIKIGKSFQPSQGFGAGNHEVITAFPIGK